MYAYTSVVQRPVLSSLDRFLCKCDESLTNSLSFRLLVNFWIAEIINFGTFALCRRSIVVLGCSCVNDCLPNSWSVICIDSKSMNRFTQSSTLGLPKEQNGIDHPCDSTAFIRRNLENYVVQLIPLFCQDFPKCLMFLRYKQLHFWERSMNQFVVRLNVKPWAEIRSPQKSEKLIVSDFLDVKHLEDNWSKSNYFDELEQNMTREWFRANASHLFFCPDQHLAIF